MTNNRRIPGREGAQTDPEVRTLERFRSRKRTVLTALDPTRYSFEGGGIGGEGSQSVFAK